MPRQLAMTPLQIAGGEIVEHQRAVTQMALGERRLDPRLGRAEQIERFVKLILVDGAEIEQFAQRMRRRRLAELARSGQLGGRLDHPRHDQGQSQPGQPPRLVRGKLMQPELARHAEHRGHVAVRQRALDPQLLGWRDQLLALQNPAQRIDPVSRPMRQVGQRARLDLVARAIALAQQDRGR